MTISVLIADDQPLMRSALRMCLSEEPDIEVVGEARDGRDAVSLAAALLPDVVIMDIRMPVLDGVAATRMLTSARGGGPFKVLVVTTFDLDEYVVDAIRAGASGFLLKDATPAELVGAVRVVAAGNAMLSPTVTKRLLDTYARLLPPGDGARAALATLTTREVAVLTLVAHGLSNAEIADRLNVAESSVKTHISHLLTKLQARQRVQLVVLAYETGLVWPGAALGDPVPARPGPARPD
jgi:DNA-binding NarL/FixJ family response regulator